jgi:glucose/arabinose dehydrogenase
MKLHSNYIPVILFLAVLSASQGVRAATLWNGPPITFTKEDGSDPSQPANQDQLTARVSITRGSCEGIYNAVTEGSYTHNFSPADTEWASGSTTNPAYQSFTYTDWETWARSVGGPPATPGVQAVLHLKTDDIYIDITFTGWNSCHAGSFPGFSYTRSTPPAADVPPTVSITSPTNGASFTAPAVVPITATAADSDGTVTNVAFFDGTTFLGQTNNTPYTVTATLAPGSHPLTAVATDNGGLSTTSSVVNVTVNAAITGPNITLTNPPDNSVFGNTDTIGFQALVTDTSGTVTNVRFFEGATLLRSVNAPSAFNFNAGAFTFTLGLHTITAVALDNQAATATSPPVHITIAPYTPQVTNGPISLFLITVATNLSAPDYGISPPGDTHRLFVLEQNGLMRIIQDGVLLPTPALDLQNLVAPPLVPSSANDERGLLGLAFHPGFNNPSSPGYQTLYTYNSELIPTNTLPTYVLPDNTANLYKNAINEWKISSTNANIVDTNSMREVISFGKNPQNHNGGTCTFGPDGYMYLAIGDGGGANDFGVGHITNGGNAQNLGVPYGKMMRFDPLNPALNPSSPDTISSNGQYRIPTNNPFQGPGQVPEIYAYGFRNPYRFCFDPVTGDLIEADVGQNNVEEINRVIRGGNYGWAIKEGDFFFNRTNSAPGSTNIPFGPAGTIGAPPGFFSPGLPLGLIDPITVVTPQGTNILEYDHNNGISITGGFVYRGSAIPELYGKYIFGDLALIANPVRMNGRIFVADLQHATLNTFDLPQFGSEILPNGQTCHGFGQDANGELYAMATSTPANGNGGVVYKLASVRVTPHLSGNLLDLSWPVAGGRLLFQTNSPGTGLGTNWVTYPNSTTTNHVVVTIDSTVGTVFYRLAVP